MRVTRRHVFNCMYFLCSTQLNIQRYQIEATVDNPVDENGIAIRFEDLDEILKSTVGENSIFIYSECAVHTPEKDIAVAMMKSGIDYPQLKPTIVNFPVSAENLTKYFAQVIQKKLDMTYKSAILIRVRLKENNNSFVEWTK